MKLNKEVFIQQDQAQLAMTCQLMASSLSPVRYGLLPAADNFDIRFSVENPDTVRVTLLRCKALTPGAFPVDIDAAAGPEAPAVGLKILPGENTVCWIVLVARPFERLPCGEIDPAEIPPRHPFVKPGFDIQVVADADSKQYRYHPMALFIGKVSVAAATIRIDEEYVPPCLTVSASPDLLALHAELDQFLTSLELSCLQIVQKIYRKSQQNLISELTRFLCDRIALFLGEAITRFRWGMIHESPSQMLGTIAGLARVIKSTIDLRTGSGKEELMNYLSEWCALQQGELDDLLEDMASLQYNHDDINQCITTIAAFAKVIGKLFKTLGDLDFIGKRKDAGLFVKEEQSQQQQNDTPRPKRRFFG